MTKTRAKINDILSFFNEAPADSKEEADDQLRAVLVDVAKIAIKEVLDCDAQQHLDTDDVIIMLCDNKEYILSDLDKIQ